MKAIAVVPGRPYSLHIREIPKPKVSDVPDGRGVLVKLIWDLFWAIRLLLAQ